MLRLRKDNERLLQDQENILKILLDKQNQEMGHPSAEKELSAEQEDQQTINNTTGRAEKSPPIKVKTRIIMRRSQEICLTSKTIRDRKWNCRGSFAKLNHQLLMVRPRRWLKPG